MTVQSTAVSIVGWQEGVTHGWWWLPKNNKKYTCHRVPLRCTLSLYVRLAVMRERRAVSIGTVRGGSSYSSKQKKSTERERESELFVNSFLPLWPVPVVTTTSTTIYRRIHRNGLIMMRVWSIRLCCRVLFLIHRKEVTGSTEVFLSIHYEWRLWRVVDEFIIR